jgi:hypothetical protein
MPPKTRKSRSTLTDRPLRNHTNSTKNNRYRPQDGYAAPTAEDRREAALLAEAAELGYRLATVCMDCGHWLANPVSVAAHRGPRCRARNGGD